MKLLIILTASFPYDNGEEFLLNEVNYINGFDKIILCPCNLKEGSVITKTLPEGLECAALKRKNSGQAAYAKLLFQPSVLAEIGSLVRTGKFSLGRVHETLFFMKQATEIYNMLKQIEVLYQADEVCIYSYWFYDAAAAAVLLKKDLTAQGIKVTQISRAHRFDIHQEYAKYAYLPMRVYLLRHVDRLYPCSDDGAKTFIRQYPQYAGKITPAYLGTINHGEKPGSRRNGLHLVSCSYMVPVKRLHLIAQALSAADFPVLWTHIGAGPLENEIKSMAEKLPDCVKTEFTGQLNNGAIMEYYKSNDISVFVNVSSSEGIPVSVMEACSFGLPIIATDVGGTAEAVIDGKNGFLLPANCTSDNLLDKLLFLKELPEEEYVQLCENSHGIWAEKFNAPQNYKNFYEVINQ
jgi:colanic acid/amylovoran biosynthesis glycosyltransferase